MTNVGSGGWLRRLMSVANMSVVRCEVVKGFPTGCTSEGALGNRFVVRLEMFV